MVKLWRLSTDKAKFYNIYSILALKIRSRSTVFNHFVFIVIMLFMYKLVYLRKTSKAKADFNNPYKIVTLKKKVKVIKIKSSH